MNGNNNAAWVAAQEAARLEDVRWMLETGESLTGAAARLGISPNALEKWLHRRNMHTEATVLRGRDPITDLDRDLSEHGRAAAEKRWGRAS